MKLPRFEPHSPLHVQLTATRLNQLVDACNANQMQPGVGVRITKSGGGQIINAIDTRPPPPRERFRIRFDSLNQRVYVAVGSVFMAQANGFGQDVTPIIPKLGDKSLSDDPPPYFDATDLEVGDDYSIRCVIPKTDPPTVDIKKTNGPSSGSGDSENEVVLATISFKDSDDDTGMVVDVLNQLWLSDIAWFEDMSSSSSSSNQGSSGSSGSTSSGGTSGSGSGSSKDTAVVPTPWGYKKWYAMEASEVMFFDFVELDVARGLTRHQIDPLVLFCLEKGTVRAFVSPERGAVTARVSSGELVVRARQFPWPRTQRLHVMLCGVRRGFAGVRLAAASFEDFVDNECRLNPRMDRDQVLEALEQRGITQ